MPSYAVKGGIGDFLQCLPFMKAHPGNLYYVASHHNDVQGFFSKVGVGVVEVPLGQMPDIEMCPRELFFRENPFPSESPPRTLWVGVHLGGSSYSLSVEARFGFPPKALPKIFFEKLAMDKRFNFLIFGPGGELGSLFDQLAAISLCSAFIGSDSAFKTMASMLKIPTIVLHGDYRDDHRDKRFIEPYVEAGVMTTFRYRDMEIEADAAVAFCIERLEALCLTSQT